jgi:hypothetical protein
MDRDEFVRLVREDVLVAVPLPEELPFSLEGTGVYYEPRACRYYYDSPARAGSVFRDAWAQHAAESYNQTNPLVSRMRGDYVVAHVNAALISQAIEAEVNIPERTVRVVSQDQNTITYTYDSGVGTYHGPRREDETTE